MKTINITYMPDVNINLKRELWEMMFPDEDMPEPYVGAVNEYAGCLGKLLPHGIMIDIDKELKKVI